MPNLILTNTCHNGCSFCFAEPRDHGQHLRLDAVKALLPFLRSFQRESVNLLGGEPTLNPDFPEILDLLLTEGFSVQIFTHGKIPTRLVAHLQGVHHGAFHFCVNRSYGKLTPGLIHFYRKLGHLIQLGVTVYQVNQDLAHILHEVSQYRLQRTFRLGIAVPVWPYRHNVHLSPEAYGAVADHLFTFIQNALDAGLHPTFDCGFPYCFFGETQRAFLAEHEIDFASNCGVIPDIGPGYTAMPCFPLAPFAQPISPASRWPALREQFKTSLNQAASAYLFEDCKDCDARKEGTCNAGCAAFNLQR